MCLPPGDVRGYMHAFNPYRVSRAQIDAANDPVPVRLCVIAELVRITHRPMVGVVDQESECVLAGRQRGGQVVDVRADQAVLGPECPIIHPGRRELRALQEKRDALALPVRWNVNLALVPGRTIECVDSSQTACLAPGVGFALPVSLGGTGKLDGVVQIQGRQGLVRLSAGRPRSKAPTAGQGD